MSGSREWWCESSTSLAAYLKWYRSGFDDSSVERCYSWSWFYHPSSSQKSFIRINR
jgi:hypothetical protein